MGSACAEVGLAALERGCPSGVGALLALRPPPTCTSGKGAGRAGRFPSGEGVRAWRRAGSGCPLAAAFSPTGAGWTRLGRSSGLLCGEAGEAGVGNTSGRA